LTESDCTIRVQGNDCDSDIGPRVDVRAGLPTGSWPNSMGVRVRVTVRGAVDGRTEETRASTDHAMA
jgi:hypothetical protein